MANLKFDFQYMHLNNSYIHLNLEIPKNGINPSSSSSETSNVNTETSPARGEKFISQNTINYLSK